MKYVSQLLISLYCCTALANQVVVPKIKWTKQLTESRNDLDNFILQRLLLYKKQLILTFAIDLTTPSSDDKLSNGKTYILSTDGELTKIYQKGTYIVSTMGTLYQQSNSYISDISSFSAVQIGTDDQKISQHQIIMPHIRYNSNAVALAYQKESQTTTGLYGWLGGSAIEKPNMLIHINDNDKLSWYTNLGLNPIALTNLPTHFNITVAKNSDIHVLDGDTLLIINSKGEIQLKQDLKITTNSPSFDNMIISSKGITYLVDNSFIKDNIANFASYDTNGNILWQRFAKAIISSITLSNNQLYYTMTDTQNDISHLYTLKEKKGELVWFYIEKNNPFKQTVIGDNGNIYLLSNQLLAFDNIGTLLFRYPIKSNDIVMDHTGVLYIVQDKTVYALQTSANGLAKDGWVIQGTNPRRSYNTNEPIHLLDNAHNKEHLKVICQVDAKTIDINKITHLKKGWHLIGSSYEITDFCIFNNVDYIYTLDNKRDSFTYTKRDINQAYEDNNITLPPIPAKSGFWIYNSTDDNIDINYTKEILPKDKQEHITKAYLERLPKGWHMIGTSYQINSSKALFSQESGIKKVLIFTEGQYKDITDKETTIPPYSGISLFKE